MSLRRTRDGRTGRATVGLLNTNTITAVLPAIRQRARSLPHKLSAQPPAARRVYVPMIMPTLWKIAT